MYIHTSMYNEQAENYSYKEIGNPYWLQLEIEKIICHGMQKNRLFLLKIQVYLKLYTVNIQNFPRYFVL